MADFEVVIIGAGVVGLAVAARLAPVFGKKLLVLEQHEGFGRETSSRNSEVIHAGIYYPKDSLKAGLCLAGRQQIYQLTDKFSLPYRRLGKLIVAVDEAEAAELETIRLRGRANGVDDLEMISARECRRLEAAVKAEAGLWSPTTGIIDSHALMAFFHQQAREAGTTVAYRSRLAAITPEPSGYRLIISNENEPDFALTTRLVINCAGLEAAAISRKLGLTTPKIHFAKGVYFVYNGRSPLKHLVYPAPNPDGHGLGIHATLDLGGRLRFGPDLEYRQEPDYQVDAGKKAVFARAIRRYLPGIDESRLQPDMAGIRPRLQGPDDEVADFIIREENEAGFPGFINLLGIESPGLTAAPAIADRVAKLLEL